MKNTLQIYKKISNIVRFYPKATIYLMIIKKKQLTFLLFYLLLFLPFYLLLFYLFYLLLDIEKQKGAFVLHCPRLLVTLQSKMYQKRPQIAIVDPNTLAVLGLKQLLQSVLPIMQIDTFGSMSELQANDPEQYFHYFVAMNIVLENRQFFQQRRHKAIVLTMSLDSSSQLQEFHSLCINVPESDLVRSLLMLEQSGHAGGKNRPELPEILQQKVLSDREIEVMALIAQGYINKEIASRLNIGLTTVVTHRKNIMEKLGMRSVSALTIYAVTHGYVDINKI